MLAAACGLWDQFPVLISCDLRTFQVHCRMPQVQDKTEALGLGRKPSVVTANLVMEAPESLCLLGRYNWP